jgi:hypothetical protein
MKKLNAFKCRSEYYTIRESTLDEVIEHLHEWHFNTILYAPSLEIEEGLLEFTQEDQPIAIGYDYVFKNYLGINDKYYLKHMDEVDIKLLEIAKKIETIYLYIDRDFINEEIKKALIDNKKIKTLKIGDELIR